MVHLVKKFRHISVNKVPAEIDDDSGKRSFIINLRMKTTMRKDILTFQLWRKISTIQLTIHDYMIKEKKFDGWKSMILWLKKSLTVQLKISFSFTA